MAKGRLWGSRRKEEKNPILAGFLKLGVARFSHRTKPKIGKIFKGHLERRPVVVAAKEKGKNFGI